MHTYLLIIKINDEHRIKIGSLGSIYFRKGYYLYIGSAKRGLMNRIDRHLKSSKRLHWHIDYLTTSYRPIKVFLSEIDECTIASMLNANYINRFGSSDCKCNSHLFYFRSLRECIREIQRFNCHKFDILTY
ncbi:MAG: GIY-YIG nuclease family protein [Candidatus Nitrosocaldaceae archaeon]